MEFKKSKIILLTIAALFALTASAENIWTGSEVINWNAGKAVQISKEKFQNLKEGDQLVFGITFTGNTDWPQIAPTKGDWSGNVTGMGNTAVSEGMTEVKYYLLKDMIADLKASGLVVAGIGFTLTSVDIVAGDGGDYSHSLWIGECKIGNWEGYQQVDKSAFANAAVGQTLRVKFKNLGAGAYLSLRNGGWTDLSDAAATYIAGSKQDYTITSTMLSELQANGMIISGVNFTATAVELWNASELKPLTLTVPVTSNWVYEGTAIPTFTVTIKNPYSEAVEANVLLTVATDKMEASGTANTKKTIDAGATENVIVAMESQPAAGIYHATITVNDDLARGFYFAVRPTEIVSAPDKQSDFESYWATAKEQLAAIPINAKLTKISKYSTTARNVYLVEMQSVPDGLTGEPVTIRGYYAEPTDGQKHPVLIHYQGYDSGM